jgi:hypothetical protein
MAMRASVMRRHIWIAGQETQGPSTARDDRVGFNWLRSWLTARLVDFVLQIAQGLFVPHSGSWITCTATVQRGLVTRPEDWTWSSARRYAPNKLSSRAKHQVRAANLMRSRGTLCGVYPVVRRRDVS